jgi:lysophospholipase L1-like esterase
MPEPPGASATAPAPAPGGAGQSGLRRYLLFAGLSLLLVVTLLGLDVVALQVTGMGRQLGHHYFLALGDSITFGYQPDLNFTAGYVDDVFADLQKAGVTDVVNYGCAGETTTSMIQGNCLGHLIHHNGYTGPQLTAAVKFLHAHPSRVSPITLEIGANDLLPDWNDATCMPTSSVNSDLATMDHNLTHTILPSLVNTLEAPSGSRPGDLVMLNYYDPFIKHCPGSTGFVHMFNDHLAADAAVYRIPIVDVYTAFGGDMLMAANICQYTWYCDPQFHDFHPTTLGYRKIADAVENALAYPGVGPAPGVLGGMGRIQRPSAPAVVAVVVGPVDPRRTHAS